MLRSFSIARQTWRLSSMLDEIARRVPDSVRYANGRSVSEMATRLVDEKLMDVAGKLPEFHRYGRRNPLSMLLKAYADRGLVAAAARAPKLVEMISAHPAMTLVHGLFERPEAQIDRLISLNRFYRLGIPSEAFVEAAGKVPRWPDNRLSAVVLVPHLEPSPGLVFSEDNVAQTFVALWLFGKKEAHSYECFFNFEDAASLRVRLFGEVVQKPGLHWEVIDLGAQCGVAPRDARSPGISPSAGVLAAAMLHPRWLQRMNGTSVPFVWIPGYETFNIDGKTWNVPRLSYDRKVGKVSLAHSTSVLSCRRTAVPIVTHRTSILEWPAKI